MSQINGKLTRNQNTNQGVKVIWVILKLFEKPFDHLQFNRWYSEFWVFYTVVYFVLFFFPSCFTTFFISFKLSTECNFESCSADFNVENKDAKVQWKKSANFHHTILDQHHSGGSFYIAEMRVSSDIWHTFL